MKSKISRIYEAVRDEYRHIEETLARGDDPIGNWEDIAKSTRKWRIPCNVKGPTDSLWLKSKGIRKGNKYLAHCIRTLRKYASTNDTLKYRRLADILVNHSMIFWILVFFKGDKKWWLHYSKEYICKQLTGLIRSLRNKSPENIVFDRSYIPKNNGKWSPDRKIVL